MNEDERIEAARAALSATAEAPESRAERKARLARELAAVEAEAAEKREDQLLDAQEALLAIQKKHGMHRACLFHTTAGPIVLERGLETHFRPFQAECNRTNNNPSDRVIRDFVYGGIAHPSTLKGKEEIFSAAPGALIHAASALAGLYGAKAAEDIPK